MTLILRQSVVALAAVALLASACNKDSSAKPASGGVQVVSAESPDTVVARYNGKDVKLKEVDLLVTEELKDLQKKTLELRKRGAEQLAIQAMVKEEAAKQGKTEEEWLKAAIDGKVTQPTEEAIAKVFEENKAQMPPGSTLDSMRVQIIGFLTQDQKKTVAQGVFEDLKKKANFEMLLQEPRVQVEAIGPAKGANDAKITIVEFSDFECPYCSRAEPSVDEVMQKYPGKVKVVFRHFPLSFHAKAAKAAEGAACAEEQGKFWEFHKTLFANQAKLGVEDLKEHAKTLGLDTTKFNECLDGSKMKAKVDADQAAGAKIGVNGTPAFFINGVMLSGAQPFSEFEKIINQELK